MRIVFVCPYNLLQPGGVRTHIFDLALTMQRQGHDVCVVGSVGNSDSNDAKSLTHQDIAIFPIGSARRTPVWGTEIDVTRASGVELQKFEQNLIDNPPDVIHFHTPWTPFLSWQILTLVRKLRKSGRFNSGASEPRIISISSQPGTKIKKTVSGNRLQIPAIPRLVATFHDSPPDSYWGKFLGRVAMPAAAKFLLPMFDEVISVSEYQSGFISRWTNKKIHIIPNGIRVNGRVGRPEGQTQAEYVLGMQLPDGQLKQEEVQYGPPQERQSPDGWIHQRQSQAGQAFGSATGEYPTGKSVPVLTELLPMNGTPEADNKELKTIFFLGRLEPRKGVMHMLEAYKLLQERMKNIQLVIAGDGPDRNKAEEFVLKQNLSRVSFLGYVDDQIKTRLFQESDIYVSPALYGESFGIVLLEAMLYGTPIAGYGNPGYLNVVGDYCPENFPPPGDSVQLAERIYTILYDDIYRNELTGRAAEIVKKYDWDQLTGRILDIYSK